MRKYVGKNQKVVNGYFGHTEKSVKNTEAKLSTDTDKIKKFIISGKVPNGTNGVYV